MFLIVGDVEAYIMYDVNISIHNKMLQLSITI